MQIDENARQFFGADFDLKRNTHFGEFVHPEDFPRIERQIATALAAGDNYFVLYRIVRTDGTTRRVSERGQRVRDNGCEYLEGCVLDITADVQLAESIGSVDDRWRVVINSLPTAVSVHIDGTLVFANEAAARLVGASSPDEIVGSDSFAFIREDHREQYREWVEAIDNIPSSPYEELPIYRVDGSCLWVRVQPSYVVFEGRQAIQTVLVDITEERRRRIESNRRSGLIGALADMSVRFLRSNDVEPALDVALERIRIAADASQVLLLRPESPLVTAGVGLVTPRTPPATCAEVVADGKPRFGAPCDILSPDCGSADSVTAVALIPVPVGRSVDAALLLAFEGESLPWTEAGQNALVVVGATIGQALERAAVDRQVRAHRDQLELALDSANMGIWDMDLDTGEVSWSEHTARIFGISLEEFRGTIEHVMQFIHPDDHAPILKALTHAKRTGANVAVKQRICRPDGQTIWTWGIGRINETASGRNRMLGTLQDVSETVNAANSARRKSARIRGMLNALPDLLLRIRAGEKDDLVITVPSRHRTDATLDTRRMHERLPVHAQRLFKRAFRRMKSTGQVVTFSYELFQGDESRIYEVRMAPSGGREAVAVVRDITSERRREIELVQARDEAQQMVRLKSAFLSNMSHEIRTPLTSIIGFSDMLADVVDGDSCEFVDIIRNSGERLMQTLNAVLDLAQIESGTIELMLRPSDVYDRIRTAVDFYAPQARLKGLELLMEGDNGKPLLAMMDASAVDRVLAHLLSNAIKFTSEGRITVSARQDDGDVVLEITDTGIGMSEEFQRRMFDPFHQESDGLARDFEGTGLGLTIIRHLITLMDASISVDSTRGEGSVFTVRLKGAENGFDAPVRVRRPEQAMPAPAETRRRVLIVEDNQTTRILMEQVLADEFDVESVSTGEEAIKRVAESQPDAVLLDVTLAGSLSGEATLWKLRERGFTGLPIIAVTARTLPGDRERLLELGFDGYVSKPFKKDHLVAALRIADRAGATEVAPAADLYTLLELCLEEGLIDGYEHGDGSVVVTQDIAHLKLSNERAHAALQAMLENV
jgi:PAS domain S-box-containing protein